MLKDIHRGFSIFYCGCKQSNLSTYMVQIYILFLTIQLFLSVFCEMVRTIFFWGGRDRKEIGCFFDSAMLFSYQNSLSLSVPIALVFNMGSE